MHWCLVEQHSGLPLKAHVRRSFATRKKERMAPNETQDNDSIRESTAKGCGQGTKGEGMGTEEAVFEQQRVVRGRTIQDDRPRAQEVERQVEGRAKGGGGAFVQAAPGFDDRVQETLIRLSDAKVVEWTIRMYEV